jgi:hypothetical protein
MAFRCLICCLAYAGAPVAGAGMVRFIRLAVASIVSSMACRAPPFLYSIADSLERRTIFN